MVTRVAELKPPHRVSDADFDAICKVSKIDLAKGDALRQRLDSIIDAFAAAIRDDLALPDRQADRDWLDEAIKAIQKARAALPSRPGNAARDPLRVGGSLLAEVITVGWLGEQFPAFGNVLAPPTNDGDPPERKPWKPSHDPSGMARAEFIMLETLPVLSALLGEVELVLKIAAGMLPSATGGQGWTAPAEPAYLSDREFDDLLAEPCRTPTSGPNSAFTVFCEAVFDAIGWPTEGVNAAVPRTLSILHYHPEIIDR